MSAPVRARRRPTVRRRRRRLRDVEFYGGLAAAVLVMAAAWWLAHHPLYAVLLAVLALAATTAVAVRKQHRRGVRLQRGHAVADYRRLNPTQFEHAIAELCRRDGCTNVEVVGGAGDLAADVLLRTPRRGRRGGERFMIQAKHYRPGNPVRSPHVQAVNGTYRYHGAERAAVVTTSSFTADALKFGRHQGLVMFAEPELAAWAAGGRPPWA